MATAYLKLGDLKGESMDARFTGWIPLESFSFGSRGIQSGAGPGFIVSESGASAFRGNSISEIVVTKFNDRSSADLQRALTSGKVFDVAVIALAKLDAGTQGSAFVMENTLISSYNFSGGGGDRPMESLSLNFTKITIGTMAQVRTLSTMLQMAGKAVQSLTGRKP